MDEKHEGQHEGTQSAAASETALGADQRRPAPKSQEAEISLLELLSVVLKHRRVVFGWMVGFASLVVLVTLVLPPKYTTFASFVPQQSETLGLEGAAALASQFGISVPTGEAGQSPQFYADLLRSRELLSRVVTDTFTVREVSWGDTTEISAGLLDLLDVGQETEALRQKEGIEWLREDAVTPTTNTETGLVEVEVRTPWPEVSARIAERLLELLNEFNLEQRQSQAMAERRFIEARLEEAEQRLLEAEEGLKRFLENNRRFRDSPELVFEHDRLQRQVTMQQEIFTSLRQSYEEARISEVRNTPVITVVERPKVPPEGDPRGLITKGLAGVVLGGMLGVFFAFGREMVLRRREEGDEDYKAFHVLWEDTLEDVRRPLRRVFRRGR